MLKPVLNTTTRCLHEAWWSFVETSWTSVGTPNILRQPFEASRTWECEGMLTPTLFDASDWLIWTSARRWRQVAERANWPQHSATSYFCLALPLRSFDIGPEWKSACGRYTINFGIPPIQNTHIDPAEGARCTLSVSCSADPDYGVVLVDLVGVFLEHVLRTVKASERLTPNLPRHFSIFCKHYNRCNINLKPESITGQLRYQSSWQNFRAVFWQLFFYIKNENVCEYYSWRLLTNNVCEHCLCIKDQL